MNMAVKCEYCGKPAHVSSGICASDECLLKYWEDQRSAMLRRHSDEMRHVELNIKSLKANIERKAQPAPQEVA